MEVLALWWDDHACWVKWLQDRVCGRFAGLHVLASQQCRALLVFRSNNDSHFPGLVPRQDPADQDRECREQSYRAEHEHVFERKHLHARGVVLDQFLQHAARLDVDHTWGRDTDQGAQEELWPEGHVQVWGTNIDEPVRWEGRESQEDDVAH